MVLEVVVETPTKLSLRQREILQQFRETETGEECPQSSGFFDKIKKGVFGE
jgi:molecular chaperone DnaJ